MKPAAIDDAARTRVAGAGRAAGFWLRAGAFVIDCFLVFLLQLSLQFLALAGLPQLPVSVLQLAVFPAYFSLLHSRNAGKTPGKAAAGIRVVREDGSDLSPLQAFLRWAASGASFATAGLGFAAAGFTREKRALHDLLAGTRVVRTKSLGRLRRAAVVGAAALPLGFAALGLLGNLLAPAWLDRGDADGQALTFAGLRELRSAAAVYRAEHAGVFPPDLDALAPSLIVETPPARTGPHATSSAVALYGGEACRGVLLDAAALRDGGGWGYAAEKDSACWGHVFVDCTHLDARGRRWSEF